MANKKVIAVVGATGAQGGGLVRAIVADPSGEFSARALTRNVDSEKARQLAELGAEVVAADVEDVGSLKRAFQGAYGAFCVTFFWEHFSPTKEIEHARAMARAAKDTGVATSSGRRSRTRASGYPSTTTACRPCRSATRCLTSMPRGRPMPFSPRSAFRRRI